MKNQNSLYGNLYSAIMSGKIELVQECLQTCTKEPYDEEAEAELILQQMEEQEEVRRLISSTVWEN